MAMSWGRNRGLLGAWVVLVGCLWQVVPAAGAEFADSSLAAAVAEAVGRPVESLTEADLLALTQLVARDRAITDLTGIEQLANLSLLDLADNEVSDLSPLSVLTRLQMLDLEQNHIRDLSPLGSLAQLQSLILNANEIEDVSPLLGLPLLSSVELLGNPLSESSLTVHIPALQAQGAEVVADVGGPGGPELPREVWEYLGPKAEDPLSVRMRRVSPAPTDPQTMYAATGNGLWVTVDGGLEWTATPLMGSLLQVFVDAGEASTAYVVASGGIVGSEHLRSRDGGWTWEAISVPGTVVSTDPVRAGRLYAAQGTYDRQTRERHSDFTVSDDGGNTWRGMVSLGGFARGQFVHVDPTDPQVMYAGGEGRDDRFYHSILPGFVVSFDGGATWSRRDPDPPLAGICPDPRHPDYLYGVQGDGVWHSTDAGMTWEERGTMAAVGLTRIIAHPLDPEWLLASSYGGELWQSTDGGHNWERVATAGREMVPDPRNAARALFLDYESRVTGLRTTVDGGLHWELTLLTADWMPVLALVFDRAGVLHGTGVSGRGLSQRSWLYRNQDGGQDWMGRHLGEEVVGGITLLHYLGEEEGMVAYASYSGYCRSEDGGVTWEPLALAAESYSLPEPRPEVVAAPTPDGGGCHYAVDPRDQGLYRSEDDARTWVRVTEDVIAVAAHPTEPDVVFVGGLEQGAVWRSRSGGVGWTRLGVVAEGERVARLGIHPLAPTRLYAVTTSGVYVSKDEAETWSAPLLRYDVQWVGTGKIRFDPRDVEVMYVTTGRQLWQTRDAGQNWTSLLEAEGSPTWINDLAVDPLDPEWLYVATPRGVYRWRSAGDVTAVVKVETQPLPTPCRLQPNYPNPFNGETVIRYQVRTRGPVVVTVHNLLGQRVTRLVQAEQAAGTHRVVWDGRDASGRPAASGVCLCRLRADDQVAVRRMLLLR